MRICCKLFATTTMLQSILLLFCIIRTRSLLLSHQIHLQPLKRLCSTATMIAICSISTPTIAAVPISASDDQIVQVYNTVATSYDRLDAGELAESLGLNELRTKLGSRVNGDVLEVGVGTGIQLPFYQWSNINEYTGFDISYGMIHLAQEKADAILQKMQQVDSSSSTPTKVEFKLGNAKTLPFQDNQFDSVVDTFSMCVYSDPKQVVEEMKRVVKPETGRIHLLENARSTNPILSYWQKLVSPILAPFANECKWDVDVRNIAKDAGLETVSYEDLQLGTIMLGTYKKLVIP